MGVKLFGDRLLTARTCKYWDYKAQITVLRLGYNGVNHSA